MTTVFLDVPKTEPNRRRGYVLAWLAAAAGASLLAAADGWQGWLTGGAEAPGGVPYATLLLMLLALGCEFVDATIGMGYGTTLSPLLVILGYPVRAVVPAAVLSQLAGNLSAAFFHHQVGNVDFLRDRRVRNSALLLGGIGLVVALGTVSLAVRLPTRAVTVAVLLVTLLVGVFMLVSTRLHLAFRWRNIVGLSVVASFSKAFTGGGYGPLVCGGQVLAGLDARAAVAGTALAEAVVCLATAGAYVAAGQGMALDLLIPLTAGSLLSTPLSAVALRRLPPALTRRLMGGGILLLTGAALLRMSGAW